MKGVSEYAEFTIVVGFSRGINISLDKGQIIDTVFKCFN